MKTTYRKPYEAPVTEIISTNISSIMYETSIPQAGEGEEGGEADAKQGTWFDNDERWDTYSPWED